MPLHWKTVVFLKMCPHQKILIRKPYFSTSSHVTRGGTYLLVPPPPEKLHSCNKTQFFTLQRNNSRDTKINF
jgi:hypothetical protein